MIMMSPLSAIILLVDLVTIFLLGETFIIRLYLFGRTDAADMLSIIM